MCATTSTYRATCTGLNHTELYSTTAVTANRTESASSPNALHISGINSNAESYFTMGPKLDSAMLTSKFEMVEILFSKPFLYAPLEDQFPSNVVNENLGYVPQTLIEWMAQNPEYVSKYPGIASCLPGGPLIDFHSYFCSQPVPSLGAIFLEYSFKESVLTVSSTVTIAGKGCFHPGACPTAAAPGAAAVAATPTVTPESQSHDSMFDSAASSARQAKPLTIYLASSPLRLEEGLSPQASKQFLPAPVEKPASTPTMSPKGDAANVPVNSILYLPNPPAANGAVHSPSTSTNSSQNPSADSLENNQEANSAPKENLAKPPSSFPGLVAAAIASAIGIKPSAPSESEDIEPSPGPIETSSYSISIAPSASAVIINGVKSVPVAANANRDAPAGPVPIAVGSQKITQNANSQYVVAGQTLTPGAPVINIDGTKVSLAPSASAIVIAGSTIALHSTSAPAFTVGSDTITANSASQYVIDGQTLIPGGPAVTMSGTRISLAPSGSQVFVGSSTIGLVPSLTPPPLTFGSQTFTADSASNYIVNGQTLVPGAPAITVSGTPISLAPGATQAIVGGSSTIKLAPGTTPLPLTIGTRVYTADSMSEYIIAGQTLIPGGPAITVSGTPISLGPSATQAVIGSSTIDLFPTTPSPTLLTVGSDTYTANSAGAYVINGQTLIPGGPAITESNTRISLFPDALSAVIGSSTEILGPNPTTPPLIIGSQTFTADSAGAYIINGQTLTPGGPAITMSNTRISLFPDASSALIGSSTETLGPRATLPPLVIASQTFTANDAGAYVIGGQTLTPGASGIVVPGSLLTVGVSAPSTTTAAEVFTVGNQIFTANPTAFSIDGTTISAGGPGVTISGTPVSLKAGGELDIGNSTVMLPLATSSGKTGGTAYTGMGSRAVLNTLYGVFAMMHCLLVAVRF